MKILPELIVAVKSGDLLTIKKKLNKKDVDLRDESGNTLLALAAANDDLNIIKYLLKIGANINTFNQFGASPIAFIKSHGSQQTKDFINKNYVRTL